MTGRIGLGRGHAALVFGALAMGMAAPAVAAPFDAADSEHWGVNARNTIGSPVAELRNGPISRVIQTGTLTRPPFGDGSLGLEVHVVTGVGVDPLTSSTGAVEKVDFGNELDFFGDPLLSLTAVGFHVFQTGENAGAARGGPNNLPVIRFEIDPNLNVAADGSPDYTTLVWTPAAVPVTSLNQWSAYLDATTTGTWFFTGGEAAATGCAAGCTFTQVKTALSDGGAPPTVYTVAVGKGRDNMWIGAVDGLRLNRVIYDFEADGVRARSIGGGGGGGGGHHDDDDNHGNHHDDDDDN